MERWKDPWVDHAAAHEQYSSGLEFIVIKSKSESFRGIETLSSCECNTERIAEER